MVKILVFGMTEKPGGMESVIMNYYRKIDKNEYQFDFLCNNDHVAYEDEIIKLGGNIYKIHQRSKDYFKYKKDIKKFFKNNASQYDCIWMNTCSLANIDYLKYAKRYNIKKRIIHCHNSKNMDSRLRQIIHIINRRFLQKFATDYWTCSTDSNEWFYGKKTTKKNNIVKINNAINLEDFTYDIECRKKYRENLNIKENTIAYLNIGRFHFQKNQIRLINIFKKINEKNRDTMLFLIGDGEDRVNIVNEIKKLNIEKNVIILGFRNDINKIINAMDALIFPSIFEGLPVTLIEAQANGLPIIASDTISKEVNCSKSIVFCDLAKNDNYWSDVILNTDLKRRDYRDSISKAGFNINVEVKKMEKLFKEV